MTGRSRRPRRYLASPVGLEGDRGQLVRSFRDFLDRPSKRGYLGIRFRPGASVEYRIRTWRPDRLIAILRIGSVDPPDAVVDALHAAGWVRNERSRAWIQDRALPVDLADLANLVMTTRAIPSIGSSEPLGIFDREEFQRRARWARLPEEIEFFSVFGAVVGLCVVVLPVFIAITLLVTRKPPPSRDIGILTVVGAPMFGIMFGLLLERLMRAGYRWRHLGEPASLLWASPTLGAALWVTMILSVLDPR